jgi:tRNA pseudouridine38-40 synthase
VAPATSTTVRAYRLAYDGTGYRGFQRQPDVATVEDALLDALAALDVSPEGTPPGYAAAGRTDAGVSALAQTVAFDAPGWLTPRALNAELPGDVRAWAHAEVDGAASGDDGGRFHATHDAASRAYRYHLHAPDADAGRARAAWRRFAGTHDFHNLTAADGDATRTVQATGVERDGPYLLLRVRAEGFVHEQVRRMVAAVAPVARGDAGVERVERLLGEERLTGPDGVGPAAPDPLVLVDVAYPGVEFRVDETAAASARAAFDERAVARRTRSRVASDLADGVEE